MAFSRQCNLDLRIPRIFNTYGPRMHPGDGRVVSNFIMQALRNEPITVYGDGSQTRSFCYITDQVDGLFKLLMSDENEPVNIGNPEEISVLEIAKEIIKLTKSKSKIIFEELPVNDPKVRQPDISKARKKIGWKPIINREDGLIDTIEYFKNLILK